MPEGLQNNGVFDVTWILFSMEYKIHKKNRNSHPRRKSTEFIERTLSIFCNVQYGAFIVLTFFTLVVFVLVFQTGCVLFFHPFIDGKTITIDSIPAALNASKTQFSYALNTVIFSIVTLGSVA